jgi:hypothetical protein
METGREVPARTFEAFIHISEISSPTVLCFNITTPLGK